MQEYMVSVPEWQQKAGEKYYRLEEEKEEKWFPHKEYIKTTDDVVFSSIVVNEMICYADAFVFPICSSSKQLPSAIP